MEEAFFFIEETCEILGLPINIFFYVHLYVVGNWFSGFFTIS